MHHCRTVLVKCTENEIEQNGEINLYVLETFFLPSLPVYYILQHFVKGVNKYLISNFSLVLNAVVFLLGDTPASEFYVPTFRNTVSSCLHRL